MKRLYCMIFIFALFIAASAHLASAQKARRAAAKIEYLNPKLVPATGAREEDFVPQGWERREHSDVEDADLNGDGIADTAIIVTDKQNTAEPALIVLFGTKDGKWTLAGVAPRLIAGAGLNTFGISDGPQMKIEKGVLKVYQMVVFNGLNDAEEYTHLFRYDPQTHRFWLIGAEYESYSRNEAHDSLKVSDNYLTNESISTVTHYRNNKAAGSTVKRSNLKPVKIYLENAEVDESKVGPFSIAHAK